MKKLIMIIFGVTAIFYSNGQHYEAWAKVSGNNRTIKGNLGYSNDSMVIISSKPSLLFRSDKKSYHWDDISSLKVRNKTIHQLGQLAGGGAGSIILINSINSIDDKNWGAAIFVPFEALALIGGGILVGHWLTSGKITIPLNGKNSKEKNQSLKSRIRRSN